MSKWSPLAATRRVAATGLALSVLAALLIFVGTVPARAAAPLPPIGWSPAPSLPTAFTPRWDFADAYYPPSDQVVVFGGAPAQLGEGWYNDTWLYSAGAWTKGPAAPSGLTARGGASMVFDPVSNKLVLFGGGGGSEWPPRNDTWLWDGTKWSAGPAAPSGLAGRTGAQMVYDPDIAKVVLFGGSGLLPYTDVWFYNGATNSWAAGPTTPQSVAPRVFFGMTYDPTLHKIVVAGGDGLNDTWYFDGTTWSPGPVIPDWVANYMRERTQFVYDPQLGGEILFGGIGPGYPMKSVFFLRGADWIWINEDPGVPAFVPPPARVEGAIVYLPTQDTMMMFGGADPANSGTNALEDAWFFRDVAPQSPSVTLDDYAPIQTSALNLAVVPPPDGYYSTTRTIQWLKNDVVIPGATGTVLSPGLYLPGDRIQSQVQYVDVLGVTGPWVSSGVAVVAQPTITVADGSPGDAVQTTGTGFGNQETVDLHLDSPGGTVLKSVTTSMTGGWGIAQTMLLPSPMVGGSHTIYAIGRTTGGTATDPFNVLPAALLSPASLGAGATTTLSGAGFASGEVVTVAFPGGQPVTVGADANGSITSTLVSPAEPYPGGNVSASAPSGTALAAYTVKPVVAVVGTPKPGAITLSLTGYGASESVSVTMEGKSQSFTTGSNGSLTATSTLVSTWGAHVITATGASSGVSLSSNITFTATVTINPTSGPNGTVVTIDSGPGWVAGSAVSLAWAGALRQTLTADSVGAIHTTYTIPTHPTGVTYFKVYDSILHASAKAAFTITKGSSILTVADGSPGTAVATTGAGFGANEQVDLHLDSRTGTILKTITANQSGSWGVGQTMPLPSPMAGGARTTYAVGRITGSFAQATFQVLPAGSIAPTKLASGASTTFTGVGFVAGQSVSVAFPGGTPVASGADSGGSVTVSLVSPPEPYPGGVVTATALSGSATASYTVASTLSVVGTPVPGNIVLSMSGFGPSESVTFTMEGQTQGGTTDSWGSLTPTITIPTTYGTHDITAVGATSGVSMTVSVTLASPASITAADGVPGAAVTTTGAGWGSSELVDIRLDSQTGQLLKTITAWTNGTWGAGQTVPLPPPLAGGLHAMYAIGQTTGYVATAQFRVTPIISMSPTKVAAGESTTVSGMGFVPGEVVAISFPGGSAASTTADATGSITAGVVSPPEPYPGGLLTAMAPSATVTASYTVQAVITETGTEAPANMPFALTGFGPIETVTFTMDGASQSFVTDTFGSISATLTIPSTWGSHVVVATGSISGVSMSDTINFTATMTIAPVSGPVGTSVAIDSGPGWVPGSTLSLAWGGAVQQTLTADASGSVHTMFTIPAHDRGVVYFKLYDSVLLASVKQPFTIT